MRLSVLAMPLRTRVLLTPRKAKQKASPKNSSLKKKGGGAPIGACRIRIEKRCGARPFSFSPFTGGPRPPGPHGAGALAFRRPTAASEPFDLGSAQAALPGTTGCKREDPLRHQCSEHLAVRHLPDGTMPKPPASAVYRCAPREPLPLRPKEYPREGVPCERDFGYVAIIGIKSRKMSLY
jgi:hypothetical protein